MSFPEALPLVLENRGRREELGTALQRLRLQHLGCGQSPSGRQAQTVAETAFPVSTALSLLLPVALPEVHGESVGGTLGRERRTPGGHAHGRETGDKLGQAGGAGSPGPGTLGLDLPSGVGGDGHSRGGGVPLEPEHLFQNAALPPRFGSGHMTVPH